MRDIPWDDISCPHCGEPPTERSVEEARLNEHLRSLGYIHCDYVLQCKKNHSWTHGVPEGDPETAEAWTCDVCGDYYIPRDVFHSPDGRIHFVVKCKRCLHKPDSPLHFRIPEEMGDEWGILLGHPLICGNTEDAEREQRVKLTMENP